jgi:hypothetical protein
MTASAPLAHYGAVGSALASGFAFAELHHHQGHDPIMRRRQHIHMLTRLRGKKLRTEFRNIQGIGYGRRGDWHW